MTKVERIAPVLLRELGERHYCNRKVVGAKGRWSWVYCRQCNLAAVRIAKKIARIA